LPHASPSIRRFARELGVDLAQVKGTGPKGRISREDVQEWVKARLAGAAPTAAQGSGLGLLPWPQVDFAKFGPVERTPLSKIRRISGANLQRNAVLIPQVTNFDEADITELEAFRQLLNKESKDGTKLTLLPFVIKAAVAALKAYPSFNSSLDGDDLIVKRYHHIGFAADTPEGLVVPVIKDADQKGLAEIAAEAVRLAADARQGKLKLGDMQGATFTISSLGGIGGTNFTPIINAPEVAILGMTRSATKPVWDGTSFQPRLVQPVSLSWDHRVVDGVAAARFLVKLCQVLGDFRRIAL
jgi:pyruvate dehydrogenase E2 component (dihydrolipoamide acetyltransferase)